VPYFLFSKTVQNQYLQAISISLEKFLKTEEIQEVIEMLIIKAFCGALLYN
jgi:hypothetical protein